MSQLVKVKHLGLAAFIRMDASSVLVEYTQDRHFVFSTEKTLEQWRLDYSNSCCMRHDSILCELRHYLK